MFGTGYAFRQHVTFIDENQCEVRGLVMDATDYPDRVILLIELDKINKDDPFERTQYYDAHLLKRNK